MPEVQAQALILALTSDSKQLIRRAMGRLVLAFTSYSGRRLIVRKATNT